MRDQHAAERQRLDDGQKAGSIADTRDRASRLRGGVMGLWDRDTAQHGRIVKQDDAEALAGFWREAADDLAAIRQRTDYPLE